MSFGNVAKDFSAGSISTTRSASSKAVTGYFAGDIRQVGSLIQYQRSPGVWITVPQVFVPETQLGNKYTFFNLQPVIFPSLSYNGKVMAVAYAETGTCLAVCKNVAGFYQTTLLPVPTGRFPVASNPTCSLARSGTVLAFASKTNQSNVGAAWIFAETAGTWTQRGPILLPSDNIGAAEFGSAISLYDEAGKTGILAVGGPFDNSSAGAVWIFTETAPDVWTQLQKITGPTGSRFGNSVCISADGTTLAAGAFNDASGRGSVFVYTAVAGEWTLQATIPGLPSDTEFGTSVSLSRDGNTLSIGLAGRVSIYYRLSATWIKGNDVPLPYDLVGLGDYGLMALLSDDGNTLMTTDPLNNANRGASWIFTRGPENVWVQNGPGLECQGGTGAIFQGRYVSLSGDGTTAAIVSPNDAAQGALWIFV